MVGRSTQQLQIKKILKANRAAFVAITGRRRVGKTYLIEEAFGKSISFRVTGIQNGDILTQISNFTQKIAEYSQIPIVTIPSNWQEAFLLLKSYLKRLSKTRKHVLFFDELPWMNTHKSGFVQLFAHLWNDYLSKEKHFVLVICGSATSWIIKNIENDKGGFHNRITHSIHLKPFTLSETKEFLLSKKVSITDNAIAELYMALGGIPFYLEQIERGESVSAAINRLCFAEAGFLKNEYQNLYKALFDQPENHEAIVKSLANAIGGLTRSEIIKASKVTDGGPFTRAIEELIVCGFVTYESPYGKNKRGSVYRLADEFSLFYHRFMVKAKEKDNWMQLSTGQKYKIWTGYAFENLCYKHIAEIKSALGIEAVNTSLNTFRQTGDATQKGFQIDLIIDRADKAINLCECKYYSEPFKMDKTYAMNLMQRKSLFRESVKTNKSLFTTMITNLPIMENAYVLEAVDVQLTVDKLMVKR
ncbi:MAG: ATP-binding protein [Saprospiraceae bacterium]|nr:ATP-binding protein [Saprospiraceae bacterium]